MESLRPRGALEIIDDAAILLRRRFVDFGVLMALAVLPGVLVGLTVGIEYTANEYGSIDPRILMMRNDGFVDERIIFVQLALSSLGLAVLAYGVTRLTIAELLGVAMGPRDVLVVSLKALPRIATAWVVVHVIEAVGSLAFGIGGVIAMVILTVAIPIAAGEPIGVFQIPKRCMELTKGARGRVFTVVVVTGVLSLLVGLALAATPTFLTEQFLSGRAAAIASIIYQAFAAMVIAAITAGAAVHTYIDLRVRREGLDLDVKLRALA